MSYIRCPNNDICNAYLQIVSDKCKEGNMDNKVNIQAISIVNDDNKYTLLELSKELPVCWECGASYSNIENEHQNKYLTFIDSIECCICLKTDNGVSFPNCIHYTCIPCHKRCFFGPTPVKLEFPYPDIEKLYYSEPNASLWKNDPKIKYFIEESSRLEDERMEQWGQEDNLRKCPICRQ